MEESASWSFTGARGAGATPAAQDASFVDATARLKAVARRYYPVGIGAAFLLMVAAFFPSTSPLLLGGSFFSAPRTPGAPALPGNSAGPAPTAEQPLVERVVTGEFRLLRGPDQQRRLPIRG